MDILWLGILAGLGLAIPVGAMSILLLQEGSTRGWRHGAVAGLGMATVDLGYAVLTSALGVAIASLVGTWGQLLSLIGAAILLVLGTQTLVSGLKAQRAAETGNVNVVNQSLALTFGKFVAATIVNPQTALYFLAITPQVAVLMSASAEIETWMASALFGVGVFLGSLIWQQILAAGGAAMHKVAGQKMRSLTRVVGGGLVVALAVWMFIQALV